jgi:hypothetical protein
MLKVAFQNSIQTCRKINYATGREQRRLVIRSRSKPKYQVEVW